MFHINRFRTLISPFVTFLVLAASPAYASTGATACAAGGTGALPWDGPLCTIQQSLTGPVAISIAIIALFAAGAALVFGDEMSGFVKRILVGVMAFALLIAGSTFLQGLNITGFTI
jgi:type IV secretory pathway VirB2 component (pilin)